MLPMLQKIITIHKQEHFKNEKLKSIIYIRYYLYNKYFFNLNVKLKEERIPFKNFLTKF